MCFVHDWNIKNTLNMLLYTILYKILCIVMKCMFNTTSGQKYAHKSQKAVLSIMIQLAFSLAQLE